MAGFRQLLLPWERQPQEAAELNHNFLPALSVAQVGAMAVTPGGASSLAVAAGAPSIGVGIDGVAARFSGGNQRMSAGSVNGAVTGTSPFSIEVVCAITASPSLAGFAGLGSGSTSGTRRELISFGGGNNRNIYFWAANCDANSGVEWRIDGSLQHVVITCESVNPNPVINFYRDGRSIGSVACAGSLQNVNGNGWSLGDADAGWNSSPTGAIFLSAYHRRALSAAEVYDRWQSRYGIFTRRILVPVAAAGGGFASTGALSAGDATVAGAAAHLTLHTATGALAAGSATVAGSAVSPHLSTGALAAGAATVAGSAARLALHASSGALSADAATVSGAALRYITHAATGAIVAGTAEVAGAADHTSPGAFSAVGALSAQDASVAGTAARLAAHAGTGAVAAGEATMAGVAVRTGAFSSSGALASDAATVSGSAARIGAGSTTISVVPPYVTVWMWKRTA